jgi:hypothetical protein
LTPLYTAAARFWLIDRSGPRSVGSGRDVGSARTAWSRSSSSRGATSSRAWAVQAKASHASSGWPPTRRPACVTRALHRLVCRRTPSCCAPRNRQYRPAMEPDHLFGCAPRSPASRLPPMCSRPSTAARGEAGPAKHPTPQHPMAATRSVRSGSPDVGRVFDARLMRLGRVVAPGQQLEICRRKAVAPLGLARSTQCPCRREVVGKCVSQCPPSRRERRP